ncbi:hypothetical protein Tcan_00598, partial [Toxocara canis]
NLCESGSESEMDNITLEESKTASVERTITETSDLPDSCITQSDVAIDSVASNHGEDVCVTPEATVRPASPQFSSVVSEDEKVEEEKTKEERERCEEDIDGLSSKLHSTTVIHSSEETVVETFERLSEGLKHGALSHKDVVDSVFNVV